MDFELRDATLGDQALIVRGLYAAWQWRHLWDEHAFQRHVAARSPDSYVDDFGHREGDRGVIAEEQTASGPLFAGAAWYRFFTLADHRPGFVSEDVPELAVAVEERYRSHGLGQRLMRELTKSAAADGLRGLSLHVSNENIQAVRLYRSCGFAVHHDYEGGGSVMIKYL